MKTATKGSTKAKTVQKAKAKLENSCLCGCGTKVARSFAQGHDARLKGQLLRGEIKKPTVEQKGFAKLHGVVIGSKAKKAA